MCGIGGIRRLRGATEPITVSQIQMMMAKLENRGNDAAGIALVYEDGEIRVWKDDTPAWRFVTMDKSKKWFEENLTDQVEMVLCHTRWATKGSPRKNDNNHPLFAGEGAVVHNGHISNDDFLFRDLKLERNAETDTDIIRAIIDEHGITPKAVNVMNRMSGSAAIAAAHPKYPGKLLLGRSNNPLVLGSYKGLLFWASTKDAISEAIRKWRQEFGFWLRSNTPAEAAFNTMAEQTAVIVGPEGVEWRGEFNVGYSAGNTNRTYLIHDLDKKLDRRKKWKDDEKGDDKKEDESSLVMCEKCKSLISIPDEMKELELYELQCSVCDANLAEKPTGTRGK